jgi:hypothetical protein
MFRKRYLSFRFGVNPAINIMVVSPDDVHVGPGFDSRRPLHREGEFSDRSTCDVGRHAGVLRRIEARHIGNYEISLGYQLGILYEHTTYYATTSCASVELDGPAVSAVQRVIAEVKQRWSVIG